MRTLLLLPLFALVLTRPVSAQTAAAEAHLDREAQQWLDASLPGWLEIYRDLHSHPELSFQEKRTAGVVERELKRSGYKVTSGIGGFGLVAVLQNGAGPTVLVRGDMDALPVAETGLAFASKVQAKDETGQVVPVMHACGHDLRVANLLAAAAFMAKARALARHPAPDRAAAPTTRTCTTPCSSRRMARPFTSITVPSRSRAS